ncbi:MAG: cell division protein FtsQ [Micavibrio aeruginosavorus]|uniref:Cell division protein FtsQ n=1 Tax=Micavibrio aeruginosavorus TaxID=349221 RepID=A0A2W4ZZD2_9BACT|nr:MAG: cell division protein FtsQ [Micavibrio aeruginosavorus]
MSLTGTRRSTILKRRSGGAERLILFIKRFGILLAVIAVILWVGAWLVMSGVAERTRMGIESSFLQTTKGWGFKVDNILVDGRSYTDADTLKAMINMEKGDPIFAFRPAEAKAMLEKISWVKSAQVERRLPDTIYIKLTEREPFALWQRNKKLVLIDKEGAVLSDRDLGKFSKLMIVVGNEAPQRAAELLSMLDAEPSIRERVEAATLIAGRRWDLKLKSGADVKLPEKELGLALRRLAVNHEEEALLDKDVLSIDVREEGRITVRTKPGAAQDYNAGSTPAAGKPI